MAYIRGSQTERMCDFDEAELSEYLAYLEAARARNAAPVRSTPRELSRGSTLSAVASAERA